MADHDGDRIRGNYLARSWALLTRDRGWVKPVLVLSLVALVPIIGPIAVVGYGLEWARLTAWGVDAAPKQKRVNVGQVLAAGWRGFVVGFVWEAMVWAVYALVSWVFGHVPGEDGGFLPGGLIDLLYCVASLALAPVVIAAQVRSAIYQRIGAGLQVGRVLKMCSRDPGGLMHMLGIQLLGCLALLCLGIVFGVVALAIVTPYLVGLGYSSGSLLPGSRALARFIAGILGSLSVPIVLFAFLTSMATQVTRLLCMTGVGLWMRQFDVSRWGRSTDPLPSSDEPGQVADGSSWDSTGATTHEDAGSVRVTHATDDIASAAATRTTTTIVREPGKRPVIETKTEIISGRGVIQQGPGSGSEESGQAEGSVAGDDTSEGDSTKAF